MRIFGSILCILIGLFLAFLAWYEAGGRDGGFDIAHVLTDGQNLLYAVGGLFFIGVGILDRLVSRGKRRSEASHPGA